MPTVIIFEVGSSFGYFRKGFTTTNALTHAVIPRSAIEGLIGAIIGLSRDQFRKNLQYSKIAVEILSPVRKLSLKYMHINPEWYQNIFSNQGSKRTVTQPKSKPFAVPISVELLVHPIYRIYIDEQKVNDRLGELLKSRQTHFTPYLGTSSMICSIRYIGEPSYNKISSKDYLSVRSIIPFLGKIPNVKLEKESKFAIEEGLTMHLDNKRTPYGTYKVLYSPEATQLQIIDDDLVQIDGEIPSYVKFLPTQIPS